jgi:ABC-type branched-subunit amino acid transport system substrate-binding protein
VRYRAIQAALLAVAVLAGCGAGPEAERTRVRGDTLTVYMSVPVNGVSAAGGEAATAGAELALTEAGGQAAGRRVKLVVLPSTRPGDSVWDPGTVEANAERAGEDPTAIAYIGELDLGGSAVSLPATNRARLLQISPADGLKSLTGVAPGRPRAGPERYYPERVRTFIRLVPDDLDLAYAMLGGARRLGARRPALVHTQGISERELAGMLVNRSSANGIEPVAVEALGNESVAADLTEELLASDPDTILLAGVRGPATTALLAALARRAPGVPVIASSGMAGGERHGRVPRQTYAYTPVAPPPANGAKARLLLSGLRRNGGDVVGPEAIHGHEAMRLVLDAIERGGADRLAVARAALEPRERRSVLGTYSVRRTGEVKGLSLHVVALGAGHIPDALEAP